MFDSMFFFFHTFSLFFGYAASSAVFWVIDFCIWISPPLFGGIPSSNNLCDRIGSYPKPLSTVWMVYQYQRTPLNSCRFQNGNVVNLEEKTVHCLCWEFRNYWFLKQNPTVLPLDTSLGLIYIWHFINHSIYWCYTMICISLVWRFYFSIFRCSPFESTRKQVDSVKKIVGWVIDFCIWISPHYLVRFPHPIIFAIE